MAAGSWEAARASGILSSDIEPFPYAARRKGALTRDDGLGNPGDRGASGCPGGQVPVGTVVARLRMRGAQCTMGVMETGGGAPEPEGRQARPGHQ
jgi:hypothetical protein